MEAFLISNDELIIQKEILVKTTPSLPYSLFLISYSLFPTPHSKTDIYNQLEDYKFLLWCVHLTSGKG